MSVAVSLVMCVLIYTLFLFQPHSLIEQLSRYKRAVAEEEFREKQLAALRVDVCSTEALKRLKGQMSLSLFLHHHTLIILCTLS